MAPGCRLPLSSVRDALLNSRFEETRNVCMYFVVSYISQSIYIHCQEANALHQAAEHDSASGILILSYFAGRSIFSSLSTDWITQIKSCSRWWLYEKQLDIWGAERALSILFNLTQNYLSRCGQAQITWWITVGNGLMNDSLLNKSRLTKSYCVAGTIH